MGRVGGNKVEVRNGKIEIGSGGFSNALDKQ